MTQLIKNFLRKRALWLLLAVTAFPWLAQARVAPLSTTNLFGYFNGSNNIPVIDANVWINDATFDNILTTYPYDTTSTVIFSNNAGMSGQVGFRFDTVDEVKGQRRPQSIFYNHGTIAGLDSPLQFFNPFFGFGGFLGFGPTTTPASYLLISATNIINSGTLQVGNVGLMRLTGKNVDLSNGTLTAGDVSDNNTNLLFSSGFFFNFTGSTTGRGITDYIGGQYVNPPQVYDIYWGATPGGTQPLANLAAQPPFSPGYIPDFVQFRGNLASVGFDLPITSPAEFDAYEFGYVFNNGNTFTTIDQGGQGSFTNYYFNFIFVKTNVVDPAITINARFGFSTDFSGVGTNLVIQGSEAMVQFGAVTNDITTGLPVTNAFYLLDNGFFQGSINTMTNASDENKVGRPSNLQITTATPFEWASADTNLGIFGLGLDQFYLPFNSQDLFPGNFSVQGLYPTKAQPYTSGSWGVQVGRQPEVLNGLTIGSNTLADLFTNFLVLPDPTNDAPRIEINATNLDLTSTYIRSEGVVNIKTKHLVPGTPAGIDVGILNGDIASTNGLLQVSKLISPTFKRVRGDVFAWSGNFNFVATNDVSTNAVHLHVLVVDHALAATFTPTFRDLALHGTNTQVSDNLRIINSSLFQAEQLSFNSTVTFAENAGTLSVKNLPNLTDFLIDTNGVVTVAGVAMIGWDRPHGINSFVNNGFFNATSPLVKANIVENTGTITATGGSSMVLVGNTMTLIPGTATNGTPSNTLTSSRNITLSAGDLTVYGSTITAGFGGAAGSLTLNVTNSFTDGVPNIPGTNVVITNVWTTSDGIVATRAPFRGDIENDLYGTEIVLTTTNRQQARVVWPAQDVGAGPDGFQNNLVIGHLILDRQTSTSSFHFSAAGGQNAMYVDYLDLRDFSFSDYRNGLFIDPNMTIYFAASNFEPQKLMAVYPGRLIWANSIIGPNSSTVVARRDGSTCLMNTSMANSQIIDLDSDGVPNRFDQFPLDNDSNPDLSVPCPGDVLTTSVRTFLSDNHGSGSVTSVVMTVTGPGKVTPAMKSPVMQAGKPYTFNAVADPNGIFAGWSGSINSTQPKVTFSLQTNMVLTARFVTNPFTALHGSYNGLFYETNGVNIDSAGAIAVNINPKGGFSGRLTMAGSVLTFGGQFDPDGNATATVPRAKKVPLTMTLKLDTAGAQQITGTIVNGTNWTSALIADRAVFGGRKIAPTTGNYTFAWAGSSVDPTNNPGGDSYGTALINRAGQLIATIRLADNNTVQQVVPVSKDGNWPLFGSLHGNEIVIGWIHIDNSSVMSGSVDWIKLPVNSGLYHSGFSNTVSLVGSAWVAPKTRGATGLNLTNPVITLANGNLGADIVPAGITFNPVNLTFTSPSPLSLTMKLAPSVGVMSGQFVDPATSRIRQFGGVMLQNQNKTRGFFLGTDESGAVRLDNP